VKAYKIFINLYKYDTGRLHAGTGVYHTYEDAVKKAKHKPRYVSTICKEFITDLELEEHSNGYKEKVK